MESLFDKGVGMMEVSIWNMESSCYMCSQWNDWEGRCDAGFWCPDKEAANERWSQRRSDAIEHREPYAK